MKYRKWIVAGLLGGAGLLRNLAHAQDLDLTLPYATTPHPATVAAAPREVIIVGQRNPLRGSDRHLAFLIESLPPDGAQVESRMDIVGWVENYAAPRRDPNRSSGGGLQMMKRAIAPPSGPNPDAGSSGLVQ